MERKDVNYIEDEGKIYPDVHSLVEYILTNHMDRDELILELYKIGKPDGS